MSDYSIGRTHPYSIALLCFHSYIAPFFSLITYQILSLSPWCVRVNFIFLPKLLLIILNIIRLPNTTLNNSSLSVDVSPPQYGNRSNEKLLYAYGFCLEENPYDAVTMKLMKKQTNLDLPTCVGKWVFPMWCGQYTRYTIRMVRPYAHPNWHTIARVVAMVYEDVWLWKPFW